MKWRTRRKAQSGKQHLQRARLQRLQPCMRVPKQEHRRLRARLGLRAHLYLHHCWRMREFVFPQWCLELGERLLPLYKGRFLNKMNLGSIYSTCFFGAVVIRGMNSNYKPKAFFNRRNLVSTCFFRAVVTAVKGDVEYIYRAVSHHQNSFKGW